MNEYPIISVIVPVYNVERYLDSCMESLIGQTLKNLEIVLVDDGSPDNCPILCDEYAQRFDNVKVVHQQNQGLGLARNTGLSMVTGKYVTFVDSDDYISLNALKLVCEKLEAADADMCVYSYINKLDSGQEIIKEIPVGAGVHETKESINRILLGMVGSDSKCSAALWRLAGKRFREGEIG